MSRVAQKAKEALDKKERFFTNLLRRQIRAKREHAFIALAKQIMRMRGKQ